MGHTNNNSENVSLNLYKTQFNFLQIMKITFELNSVIFKSIVSPILVQNFKLSENPHYLKPFVNLANEFRRNQKGRKRKCFIGSKNVKEFLEDLVTPQWNLYLEALSERERSIGIINKGTKYAWIQFFKDIQKFYRLMFRLRFHRCDKRNDDNQGLIVQWVLQELGFECDYDNIYEVFGFFYSVLNKLRKDPVNTEEEKSKITFSKVFEEDSKENIQNFINHKVSRLFLIFFIMNFGRDYIHKMTGAFQVEVEAVITYLATQYSIKF